MLRHGDAARMPVCGGQVGLRVSSRESSSGLLSSCCLGRVALPHQFKGRRSDVTTELRVLLVAGPANHRAGSGRSRPLSHLTAADRGRSVRGKKKKPRWAARRAARGHGGIRTEPPPVVRYVPALVPPERWVSNPLHPSPPHGRPCSSSVRRGALGTLAVRRPLEMQICSPSPR